jgi:hypothetical protein
MIIDDRATGHDGLTVLSNDDTGKTALLAEIATAAGVRIVHGKIWR